MRGQVASKAKDIQDGADMADLSLRHEGTTFSMDAVFLAALHAALLAELFTEVPEELSIRVDFMVGVVRLHPSTTIMGEVLHRSGPPRGPPRGTFHGGPRGAQHPPGFHCGRGPPPPFNKNHGRGPPPQSSHGPSRSQAIQQNKEIGEFERRKDWRGLLEYAERRKGGFNDVNWATTFSVRVMVMVMVMVWG